MAISAAMLGVGFAMLRFDMQYGRLVLVKINQERTIMKNNRIEVQKCIALVAHDNKKSDLLEWAKFNRGTLAHHILFATGTTGELLAKELELNITRFASGPLGGDMEIGAKIAEGRLISSSSSGIRSNLSHTIQISKLCCVWPC